jgi:CHAT domain-containing protein
LRQAARELDMEMRLAPRTPARRSDRELADALRRVRADLNDLIKIIRDVHPDFMPTNLNLSELLKLIPEGGALVAPLITANECAVFVVPHGAQDVTEAEIVPLESPPDGGLTSLLQGSASTKNSLGWLHAYEGYRESDGSNPWFKTRWFRTIETVGQVLWKCLLGPVHDRLKSLGLEEGARVLLMPQGGLGLLPLHAAWRTVGDTKRYFLDDWTVAYAPSHYVHAVSSKRLAEPQRQGQLLLAVCNPTGDLPFTSIEGKTVAALFAFAKILDEDQATVEAVMSAAPGSHYLHLACHGFYDWLDPMRAGLHLAGHKSLTLSEIIARLDLSACRLVTVSACETGITEKRQAPDEFLGLPAGFLQAGAPAVISTLWQVDDLSTMLLMGRFYYAHLRERLAPAAALRAVQLWLRDSTAGEMRLAERWYEVYKTTADPNRAVRAIKAKKTCELHPDTRPFRHPYYWAPFTLSGA